MNIISMFFKSHRDRACAQHNESLISCTLGNWFPPSTGGMCLWWTISSVTITSFTSTFKHRDRRKDTDREKRVDPNFVHLKVKKKKRKSKNCDKKVLQHISVTKILISATEDLHLNRYAVLWRYIVRWMQILSLQQILGDYFCTLCTVHIIIC